MQRIFSPLILEGSRNRYSERRNVIFLEPVTQGKNWNLCALKSWIAKQIWNRKHHRDLSHPSTSSVHCWASESLEMSGVQHHISQTHGFLSGSMWFPLNILFRKTFGFKDDDFFLIKKKITCSSTHLLLILVSYSAFLLIAATFVNSVLRMPNSFIPIGSVQVRSVTIHVQLNNCSQVNSNWW